jgi:hypothetical protein
MIKLVDILFENKKVSTDFYQQVLDKSNGVSTDNRKYFQGVINSVKKQDGMATDKQLAILKRLQQGDFKYHPKN